MNCWNSWCWCCERILRPPRCHQQHSCSWSFSLAQDQQRHNTSQCPAPKCGTHFSCQHFLPTNRVIQKRQGTPCTPKQCHKVLRKVQRAAPASIFGGISLGIHQTATKLLVTHYTWKCLACLACDRVVKRDNIGICTRSMHRPPITLVTKVFDGFCKVFLP